MAMFQTKHLWIKHLADGVAELVLDRHNSPVNYIDSPMLDDLAQALESVTRTGQYHLLAVRSAKPGNFCHGAPSTLVATWKKEDFDSWAERGQKLCSMLAEMPIPSVAVITGTCWDAGLELALACDHRVVVNRPAVMLGFPDLEWGMMPCWGGTQRLPHLVGLDNSAHLLIGGERLTAEEAWTIGLADELAEETDDIPPAFFANPVKRDWYTFPRRSWRERWLESNRPGRWFLFRGVERVVRTRVPQEMPVPSEMLQALRIAFEQPSLQSGLDFERHALQRIAEHPALAHLLRLLQQREKLRSPVSGAATNRIHHVGIIGSGVLGLSLLLHAVSKGYEVVLRAEDELALGAALTHIIQLLQSEVQRGTMSAAHFQKTLQAIRGTYTWTHFDKLDLVVDTTAGTLAEKQLFYEELEKRVSTSTLLAAVPHAYRIKQLQDVLRHPERLLGLTIIEPWNRGSVAELVVPATVSRSLAHELRDWAASLGKCCLEVPDRPGGLIMRIWMPALNEAGLMVRAGVPIHKIDEAMRRFGMTYGPLEWIDRLGVDHIASLMTACQSLFADRITFESGFELMEEKQWLGNRTDFGFYHRRFGRRRPYREAEGLWRREGEGETLPIVPILSDADLHAWIQKRLVMLMVLEAVRCLDEGIVKVADDLDCAMCLTGWATHRGGPIGYGRQLGSETVAKVCSELANEHGARFAPVAALKEFLSPSR